MRVLLKKAARINHKAGEIVEVSPDQAEFLLSVGAAEFILDAEKRETPEKATKGKREKK